MNYYENIIIVLFFLLSITSVISVLMALREKHLNRLQQERMEELNEFLIKNLIHLRDSEVEHRIVNSKKGFSDEYDEMRYLLKEIRSIRNEIRREMNAPVSINTDLITSQVSKVIQQSFYEHIKPDELSRIILSELADQMSFDHFYELKEEHYRSKYHDTSRTLLNVLHVLRTPLSGIKINVQSLRKLNEPVNAEMDNKIGQIEAAVSLIEANMRTLGAYEEENGDLCDLKENIQRNISLLLLTADKRVVLNSDSIPKGIVLSENLIDTILTCVSCVVENAIVFSPDNSEIKIKADLDGNLCKLSVSNVGSTISDEIGDKIFNDGFTSREGGHGIGLNLAKTIIEDKLNGTISFENINDPVGVTFYMTFEVV